MLISIFTGTSGDDLYQLYIKGNFPELIIESAIYLNNILCTVQVVQQP